MKAQVLLPKVLIFLLPIILKLRVKLEMVEVPFGSKKEIGVIWKNN